MGISVSGTIRHLERDVALSAVLSITVGYTGRKRGPGCRDEEGVLTHHLWPGSCKGEHGPYWVAWLCYSSWEQLMRASVGTFSRLWIGSAGASALAACDRLQAPQELVSQLDGILLMPRPFPDWDFQSSISSIRPFR